jgi:hypothetical protein
MPRKPNENKRYYKWTNEPVKKVTQATMGESLSVRAASQLLCVPLTALQSKISDFKFVSAGLSTHLRDINGRTPESLQFSP